MSLLSQSHPTKLAKRNFSSKEIHEVKILNLFMKYMVYYSDQELNDFRNWIENKTKFELYQGLKVLDIGPCLGGLWIHHPQLERFELEIINQSLISVKAIKKNLLAKGANIVTRQMEYTNLIYENYTFDRIFSKISFQIQTAEEQFESLKEASRVLKATGIHYILVNEQSLISSLYQLIKEFNHEFDIINPYQKYQIDIEQQLAVFYDEIEVTEYEGDHFVRDVKQCMDLFLSYEDQNYIDLNYSP